MSSKCLIAAGPRWFYIVLHMRVNPMPDCWASLKGFDSESDSLLQATQRLQLSRHACASKNMQDPIGDVSLGPLLGQGSHGCAYLAKWHAATIAVKVQ